MNVETARICKDNDIENLLRNKSLWHGFIKSFDKLKKRNYRIFRPTGSKIQNKEIQPVRNQ